MTELAAVILAHGDPQHLRRLVGALDDVPTFLHVDAKTDASVFGEMVRGLPSRVELVDRVAARLASWSLVEAELRALRLALEATRAEHVVVMSGADYPLLSMEDLVRELKPWQGSSYFWNTPLPSRSWDTPRHPDGGMWRLKYRFLTHHGHVLFARGHPLHIPVRRPLPAGLEPRASSQWKILSRGHVEALCAIVDRNPELIRFWRSTLVPDESFVATTLASRSLLGTDALPACAANPWYIKWLPGAADHPEWLTLDDYPDLLAARQQDSLAPSGAYDPWHSRERPSRKLFARKFATQHSGDLLTRIDADLRT